MDGFAVRSSESVADAAVALSVIEDIKAGDLPQQTVQRGQCSRIMTGAPVPSGADAVIRVEDTRLMDDGRIEFCQAVKSGNDIRPLGENMRIGQRVLSAGSEITPGVIGVLATVKCQRMQVYRRPRVAILSTLEIELEALDEPLDPNKIPNSNSYALMAQMQTLGIEPVLLGIARDDPAELAEFIKRGLEFDALLVSGGSSVGVHDHVRPTLAALGLRCTSGASKCAPAIRWRLVRRKAAVWFWLAGQSGLKHGLRVEHSVLPALRRLMGHRRVFRRTVEGSWRMR